MCGQPISVSGLSAEFVFNHLEIGDDGFLTQATYNFNDTIFAYNNEPFRIVSKTKYLGLKLDSKLLWKDHIRDLLVTPGTMLGKAS